MAYFWDERFAQVDYVYGKQPNDFIKKELSGLNPGKILLPAEGEGRNAVYAAELGWEVEAFDLSSEGRTKALRLAKEKNVCISYGVYGIDDLNFPKENFDAIALSFFHSPNRTYNHNKLLEYLKPGGKLILVGFSKEQLNYQSGGPQDVNMLFSTEELLNDFKDVAKIDVAKKEVELNEGLYHRGKASVIELTLSK